MKMQYFPIRPKLDPPISKRRERCYTVQKQNTEIIHGI